MRQLTAKLSSGHYMTGPSILVLVLWGICFSALEGIGQCGWSPAVARPGPNGPEWPGMARNGPEWPVACRLCRQQKLSTARRRQIPSNAVCGTQQALRACLRCPTAHSTRTRAQRTARPRRALRTSPAGKSAPRPSDSATAIFAHRRSPGDWGFPWFGLGVMIAGPPTGRRMAGGAGPHKEQS